MKFEIPADFDENVAKFGQILAKFNQIHSLTNYDDIRAQAFDSIEGLNFIENSPKIAIDVGSGAGIPAIFLAMILRDCEWNLFEPNRKKSAFLSYAKVELGLKNLKIWPQKIEICPKFRADLITSRALGEAKFLLQICAGFYDEKTEFLLYKGESAEAEISGLNAQIHAGKKNRKYLTIRGVKWR